MNYSLAVATRITRLLGGRTPQPALVIAMVLASGYCSGCALKKTPAGEDTGQGASPKTNQDTGEDSGTAGQAVTGACSEGQYERGDECQAVTECEPGEYVSTAASETTDRICAQCPHGQYSDLANSAKCRSWKACNPGEFVAEPGTVASEQICEPCPAGMVSRARNAPSCGDPNDCQPGEELLTQADEESCRTCDAGEYCAGGERAAESCAAGAWDHDGSAATPCVPWTPCVAQTVLVAAGTATTDQQCAPCQGAECDVCPDGARRDVKCGLNSRGTISQRCESGTWTELSTCQDPDVCVDDESMEPATCGPNGNEFQARSCKRGQIVFVGTCARESAALADLCVMGSERTITIERCGEGPGDQTQICVRADDTNRYEWKDVDSCVPHNCAEGDTRTQPHGCGLNSLGEQLQRCEVREGEPGGRWLDDGACLNDTTCVANDMRTNPIPCGLNGAGTRRQRCTLVDEMNSGTDRYLWTDEGECHDPHNCVIGQDPEPFVCGLNGNGSLPTTCPDGVAISDGACDDPDDCIAGQTRVLTSGCTDGSVGQQHQVCEDSAQGYTWVDTSCADAECTAGAMTRIENGCGMNSRGVQELICDSTTGRWVSTATQDQGALPGSDDTGCADPDQCADGDTIAPANVESASACGRNGNGELGKVCVGGQWEDDLHVCTDPDSCQIDELRPSTAACVIDGYEGDAYLVARCKVATSTARGANTEEVCLGEDRCGPERAERLSADTCVLATDNGNTTGRLVQVCEQQAWIATERCQVELQP